jgi:uncharacterized membrane protein
VDSAWLLALGIGIVSGLRVFTPIAAIALVRGGVWGYVLALVAIGELIADMLPTIPSRTAFPSILIRPLSGAFAGWTIATMHGSSPILGAILGIVGALAGTYGGHAARLAAIARIGAVPAAVVEDVVAIGLAALIVTR